MQIVVTHNVNALTINQVTAYFIIIALSVTVSFELMFENNNMRNDYIYVLFLGLIGTLMLIAANSFAIVLLALELQSFAAYLLVATGSHIRSSSLIISLNYFF